MSNEENENTQQIPQNENNSSIPDFEDSELDDTPVDLSEEIDSDEEELLPPEEENAAKEINVGTILGVVFIGVIIIIMIVMLATSGKKKKTATNKELDKAGSKTEVTFKENGKYVIEETFGEDTNTTGTQQKSEKEIDEILDSLPEELQFNQQPAPGQAPVSSVGSSSSTYKSDRPDTRNSKSPRKIDGLKGQASPDTNQNIVSALMNGNYNPNSNQKLSKEDYISQLLEQSQSLQNQMYGTNTSSSISSLPAAYQQNKEEFYSNGNGTGGSGQYMSYNSLWDGTIISGALVTAINTDNPGVVIARVTENVYSSYDHSFLLIPEGSLLYATYNSSVSYGQNKVQVAWNLLIRPDGYRITLGNMNGVNAQGASGYKGNVNNHPFETLKALGLIAVYSMIQTEIINDINDTKNEYLQNAMTDVYAEANKIGNKIVDRALDIKPTITIKAGTEIKFITNTPLELPPMEINQATKKYIRTN